MAEENAGSEKKAGGIKGLLGKLPVLIGGVMVIEAVALFGAMKILGGGAEEVHADEHEVAEHETADKLVEVDVGEFKARNRMNGRQYVYDVQISVRVHATNHEKVQKVITDNPHLIQDRMTALIRQIDPQKLSGGDEPGLETLRRQVKYQLDLIVGEDLIQEVLVPRCIPYRADF